MTRTDDDNKIFNFEQGIPLAPVHPGRTLAAELQARGLTPHAAALKMRIPANRLALIVSGQRGITADTALRLGALLSVNPQFWMNLQSQYDLGSLQRDQGKQIAAEVEAVPA